MKKVLVITYHWPPSGGITVLRCLKFVKYLRDFGWEPIVFTAKNASYQFYDYSNEKEIPEGLEIHKVPIFEPVNAFKKISGRKKSIPLQNIASNSTKKRSAIDVLGMWIRGNFFIPDARKNWIKPSIKYLENYLKKNQIDAILTDGPPHTNTVIGMRISQKFNIPWLADFQDPWTQVDYFDKLYIGKIARRKHQKLEQEVFKTAQKITIASDTWKVDLESIGAKDVDIIYYGYDETEFKNYSPKKTNKIIFFHGGLLGNDRNPINFIKALSFLIEKYPELKNKLELRLAGEVDYSVIETIEKHNLKSNTSLLGMISRKDVMKEYEIANFLILPINQAANAKGRIPGKLFEMLRATKPILVFGPNNGDVKKIVENSKRGISFEYDEYERIFNEIEKLVQNYDPEYFDENISVYEYSNYEITKKIGYLLDQITK